MGEPNQCKPFLDVAQETLVLAVKVAEKAVTEADLVKALSSPKVREKLDEVILEFARKRVTQVPLAVSESDARKLLTDAGKKAASEAGKEVLADLKKAPEFKQLEKSAERLGDAIACRNGGLLYDPKAGIVLIVATGAVVSGAIALYVARAGGEVTSALTGLAEDSKIKVFSVSGLKLSVGVPQLDTSERKISEKITLEGDWKAIKAALIFKGEAKDEKLSLSANAEVVIPVRPVTLKLTGGLTDYRGVESAKVQMGLRITLDQDRWKLTGMATVNRPLLGAGGWNYGAGLELDPKIKGTSPIRYQVEKGPDTLGVPLHTFSFVGRF